MRRVLLLLLSLAVPTFAASAAAPADLYQAAVANPARSAADCERDALDKPAEVLALAGIKPGMTVADIFGGGGYYSELASYVVGPKGKVLLANNAPYDKFLAKEFEPRLAHGRLPNVEHVTIDPAAFGIAPASVDVAMIIKSYHDLYYIDPKGGWPAIDAGRFLDQVHAALKPGGTFLIVDHVARAGSGKADAQTLHRIDPAFAKRDIESHGFELVKTWDGLRNPADDHVKTVFDKAIRGHTDRFVQVYRKR
ncbi:MAG TPA: methyltransferase [Mizugakiibacter sp.]